MPSHSDPGVARLRRVLRDLVALSAILGAWVGKKPPAIAAGLADVLIESMRLDFAFVRLCDPDGNNACEIERGNPFPALLGRIHHYRAERGRLSRTEIVPGTGDGARVRRGIVIPIGVNAEYGFVAAAGDRLEFPDEIDQLLLPVAASHAATAFRMARLVDDHQRAEAALCESERLLRAARDDLETRVEERTAELRRSEAYLAQAQRLTRTGTWVRTPTTNKILYRSEELLKIFGFDPEQSVPSEEEFAQRVHPGDVETFLQRERNALSTKADHTIHFRIVVPDGTVKYIESTAYPCFNETGEIVEFIGSAVDITERKRAQEEHERLGQLESDLAHMNRLGVVGELVASLAHEVTQPIASARNNARAALNFLDRQPPDLGEVRDALGGVVGDADRAGDIIGRIRDHIKNAPPRKDRFDLNEAINEVIVLARSAIAKNGVLVQTRLTEGLLHVQGDCVQVQQVILNLILNAVEAMSSVDEGARELLISTEQNRTNCVLVAVRDSGPGIDPERIERVFDAFYTTKSSGLGMGLSICRSIINAHGGRLWADVNEPRGAVFQFTLPSLERSS
jgi:PAS domain S-box-containing protein